MAHWTTLTAHVAEFDGNKAPGAVVRMMQTAVVPKLDDPDGVPIPGLPAYRVKRIDAGTSAGKSRGHDAFTIIHEDAGRSWTSPSAWTPEAADAWNAAWRGRSAPPLPTTAWIADSFCQTELLKLDTPTLIDELVGAGPTTIERLCADALVAAERRIEARIAERVSPGLRRDLEHLLEETADAAVTRFVSLRQFEPRRPRRTW